MRRTRRTFLERLLARLPASLLLAPGMTPARADAPGLTCRLELPPAPRGAAARPLRLVLINRSTRVAQVLTWSTPFEGGWLGPFVQVLRDGEALTYRGVAVKRGDPARDEYLRIAPGQRRQATVDLAEAFDLSAPGAYVVQPQLRLHDVVWAPARVPRPREGFQPMALTCAPVRFTVTRH